MNLPPWAEELLAAPVARLATTSAEGIPSIVPICFAIDGDIVWSVIDEKPKSGRPLKRIRNIEENPNVALLFDRYDNDWSKLAWVVLHGRADVVSAADHPAALALLRARYPRYEEMALESSQLVRIGVQTVVSWRASAS
ncbi:MAG: TIGR03668 family PPOX class F420-dependent oxidoreductase [Dehalococcoidia bacterium]